MANVKVIATDMDGTFISNDEKQTISVENYQAFSEVQKKGLNIFVVTGRSSIQASKVLMERNIKCPMICANGALILDSDKNVVHKELLTVAQVKTVLNWMGPFNFYIELYTNKGHFTKSLADKNYFENIADVFIKTGRKYSKDEIKNYIQARIEEGTLKFVNDYDEVLTTENLEVYKIFAISHDQQLIVKLREFLRSDPNITETSSWLNNVEITAKNATKGYALKLYVEKLGESLENTMAIGDNYNDLSMLEIVGTPVVMKNSPDEIKNKFLNITDYNYENGFAKAINKYVFTN